jgi:hypothetical protein
LSLKGSSKLVTEFFEYSINTILFQRGVYPAEDFTACVSRPLAGYVERYTDCGAASKSMAST